MHLVSSAVVHAYRSMHACAIVIERRSVLEMPLIPIGKLVWEYRYNIMEVAPCTGTVQFPVTSDAVQKNIACRLGSQAFYSPFAHYRVVGAAPMTRTCAGDAA